MSAQGPKALAVRIADRVADLATGSRRLIALAGPPAVGKSTVAAAVVTALEARGIPSALVPMDGFHLDNALLEPAGLLPRKGAPETFDLGGFRALMARLQSEGEVVFPTFDRKLDKAIAGSGRVTEAQATVVIEGNYLLLNERGWRDLSRHWALSVYLTAPMAELEARLVQRWLDHGLAPQDARARAEANDLPNARRIEGARMTPDLILR